MMQSTEENIGLLLLDIYPKKNLQLYVLAVFIEVCIFFTFFK